jgi:negative regulator of sigma E activity
MNEDYLWNRSGNDPEIEELEEALSVFRHRSGPPRLLDNPVAEETSRHWWRLIMLMPAAAALLVAVYFVVPQFVDQQNFKLPDENFPAPVGAGSAQNLEGSVASPISGTVYKASAPPRATRKVNSKARRSKARDAERSRRIQEQREAYALERLKLAFAITGEQFQILKDAIDGKDSTPPNEK